MAKKNADILEAKTGIICKYAVDIVKGNYTLRDNNGKAKYINALLENESNDVCLIGYCVLNTKIYIIVKGINKKALNKYIKSTNRTFYNSLDNIGGFPFRPIIENKKIKNKNLNKELNILHQYAPNGDAAKYSYCSYNYLESGLTDAITIIKKAADNEGMTLEEFEAAMNEKVKTKQKTMRENEDFSIVLEQINQRYVNKNCPTPESNIIFIIGELCDRTGFSYKRIAKKLGINPNRRDIMIGVVCDMVIRRKYAIDTVMAKMKLIKENKFSIIVETIAELNRIYNYSYDYILGLLGVNDPYNNLLAEIIRGMNKQFSYTFETICVRFHLQNDLISLRQKCGL